VLASAAQEADEAEKLFREAVDAYLGLTRGTGRGAGAEAVPAGGGEGAPAGRRLDRADDPSGQGGRQGRGRGAEAEQAGGAGGPEAGRGGGMPTRSSCSPPPSRRATGWTRTRSRRSAGTPRPPTRATPAR